MKYVLSDIHGNKKQFDSIMEQINLQGDDTFYVLGDVIDRHPHGIRILRQIMDMPNARMLLGNHEYMMMRALGFPYDGPMDIAYENYYDLLLLWYQNGGMVTHRAWNRLSKKSQGDIVDYLKSLPLNIDVEAGGKQYKLVHAAPADSYDEVAEMMYGSRTKYCVWDRDKLFDIPRQDHTTVFGHTVTIEFHDKNPMEIWTQDNLIGIDCGSGYPKPSKYFPVQGRLACLRLDDMQEFYAAVKTGRIAGGNRKTVASARRIMEAV